MLKKGLCLVLALILIFTLSGCADILGGAFFLLLVATSDDSADKDEVLAFVCDHEKELMKAVETADFSAFENQGFIRDIRTGDDVVDFSCGGAGVGSGTSYVGFFYTPDNDRTALWWCGPSSEASLERSGTGFEWREETGDNYYYTEHICGNFYYYEASF